MIHDSEKESANFNRSAEASTVSFRPELLAARAQGEGKPKGSAVRLTHRKPEPRSRRSHEAIIRLCKKMANEDVRERTHPRQTHRYYHSTRHLMQPVPPILTSEDRSSARQPSPQDLAERAAIILALNVTSGKKSNQS